MKADDVPRDLFARAQADKPTLSFGMKAYRRKNLWGLIVGVYVLY
jgi:hypothetical protein